MPQESMQNDKFCDMTRMFCSAESSRLCVVCADVTPSVLDSRKKPANTGPWIALETDAFAQLFWETPTSSTLSRTIYAGQGRPFDGANRRAKWGMACL